MQVRGRSCGIREEHTIQGFLLENISRNSYPTFGRIRVRNRLAAGQALYRLS